MKTLETGDRFSLSVDKIRNPLVSQAKQGDRIQLDDLRCFEVYTVEPDGMLECAPFHRTDRLG